MQHACSAWVYLKDYWCAVFRDSTGMKIYSNVWSVQQHKIWDTGKKMSFSSQHVQLSHVYIFSDLLYSFRAKSCPKLPERTTSMRRGGWRRLPVSASCRLPPLQVHLSISSLQHRWQSIISGSNGCQFCLIVSSYFFLAQAFKLQIMWFVISDLTDPFSCLMIIHQKKVLWPIISKSCFKADSITTLNSS